eukprot:scaffold32400_cov124-Isochrysis_galbana.AAC.2
MGRRGVSYFTSTGRGPESSFLRAFEMAPRGTHAIVFDVGANSGRSAARPGLPARPLPLPLPPPPPLTPLTLTLTLHYHSHSHSSLS